MSGTKHGRRGSAMLEFGIAMAVIFPVFAGSFQWGYSYYIYNGLESAVRAGARHACTATYSSQNTTPDSAYETAVKNMVVYGSPTGGTHAVLPNLTTSNVFLQMTFNNGAPVGVAVEIRNYPINGIFGNVTLTGKPRSSFPYLGRWDPVI